MSRQIDLSKTLSDEDRQYLVDRDRWDDLRAADAGVETPASPTGLSGSEPSGASDRTEGAGVGLAQRDVQVDPRTGKPVSASESGDAYEDLTNEELRDELESRELSKSGNKSELIARLREDDALNS